jgi:hypothetical protein
MRSSVVDIKVSNKIERLQPEGMVDVLVDSIFDLYPIYAEDGLGIVDIEIIDDPAEEALDRAMFATVRQKGQDPQDPNSGIPWAEAMLGEIPSPILMSAIEKAVQDEGGAVKLDFQTIVQNGKETMAISLELLK